MANGKGTFLQQIGDVAQVLSGTKTSGQGPTLAGLQQGRQIQELTGQLGQQFQQGGSVQSSPQLAQLAGLSPQAAQQVSGVFGQIGAQREKELFEDAESAGISLDAGDVQGAIRKLNERIQRVDQRGGNSSDSREVRDALEAGDFKSAKMFLDATRQEGRQLGVLKAVGADLTSGQREFQSLTEGLSVDDIGSARRIKLGLDPRATGSASQTIAATGTSQQVAESEAIIAGEKEAAKLESQLKFKPKIVSSVKKAEALAKAEGETFTDLKRARAALPGLKETIGKLRDLAPIASSTLAAKIFDGAVKQTGFGATKGATARAKFIAIINNQVLPLLKPTFGAAFTVQEGESLKHTLGDPDSTPEEKMAQLDAFIEQKIRDIERLENESQEVSLSPVVLGSPQGTKVGRFVVEVE